MRFIKWVSILAGFLLIAACFMAWIHVPSRNIIVSGVDAGGTNIGKPGYLHLILTTIFLVFSFIPLVWAKRWNLAVVALNLGWAIRNYLLITGCQGGVCPEKQTGMYLLMICSLLILLGAIFPDIQLKPVTPARPD